MAGPVLRIRDVLYKTKWVSIIDISKESFVNQLCPEQCSGSAFDGLLDPHCECVSGSRRGTISPKEKKN
jgi:hypothetical protein